MPPDVQPSQPAPDAGPILIVEDNQVNVMILRAMLRKRGYEPIVASSGREGIELTQRHRPRLVLMDLHMPELDGFATTSEILGRTDCGEPIILAVTANVGADTHTACRAAGFAGILAKPIVYDDLISAVESYLHR